MTSNAAPLALLGGWSVVAVIVLAVLVGALLRPGYLQVLSFVVWATPDHQRRRGGPTEARTAQGEEEQLVEEGVRAILPPGHRGRTCGQVLTRPRIVHL